MLPVNRDGRVSLPRLLRRLADEGIMHVLCEGGGELAGGLIRARLADECLFFYAPAILGDARAVGGVTGADFSLARMPRMRIEEITRLGADLLVRSRPDRTDRG
jgi:diaminohydroxyphosphoribosylaminopyrimidine deaminase/5-amino-6-(5-phosphoribosylamino)uracil reductase